MASITLGGNPVNTIGELPSLNTKAASFTMTKADLTNATLEDYKGKKVLMNIFPSIDTGVCATSVRKFNEDAANLENTVVLCISKDLPFAQKRFCGAEGIENIEMLSDFKTGAFGKDYGLEFVDGALEALHSRCVVALNGEGTVVYTEQVAEIGEEPNYEAALEALKNA